MTTATHNLANRAPLDRDRLRDEIRNEYREVAVQPDKGFHFHTGRKLARMLEYSEDLIESIPDSALESFAGTGNPFRLGPIQPCERVVDIGCGAGVDSILAARMTGRDGYVIGVDMTREMIDKARHIAGPIGLPHLEFRLGYMESLPVADAWADVVISNGAINLCPDKNKVFAEIYRVLKPGGRLQLADIMIKKPVTEASKLQAKLWTG